MTEHELIAAIRADYDNYELRHALADWYDTNGQTARAQWIRACVDCKRYPFNSPEFEQATVIRRDMWQLCKPDYWDELSAGLNMSLFWDLGMHTVSFAEGQGTLSCTPRAMKLVGKQKWLGRAYDEGWLLRMDMRFDDGTLGRHVAKWKPPVSQIPLWVKPAPHITNDGLRAVFALPQLCGMSFFSQTLQDCHAVLKLGSVKKLRRLKMNIRFFSTERWALIMEQLLLLENLYELKLESEWNEEYGLRPTDKDILRFAALKNLKKLDLVKATAITDEAIAQLRALRPDLRITRTV